MKEAFIWWFSKVILLRRHAHIQHCICTLTHFNESAADSPTRCVASVQQQSISGN